MDFTSLQPEHIIRTIESRGFSLSGHIQQLNSMENRVFDLRQEDGNHLVAKFYRPGRWNRDAILEEHRLLARLQEQEVPVCAPLIMEGETLFEEGGLFYAVWPRTGGRLIDEFTDALVQRLGSYIARIHNAAEPLNFSHRPQFSSDYMVVRHREYLMDEELLPPAHRDRYLALSASLEKLCNNMLEVSASQPVHGDCHTGNILLAPGSLFFLDFDDSMTAPPLQDMWMIVSDNPDGQQRKIDRFLEGYTRFRNFPTETLSYIELFRALRFLAYNGWLARRREDQAVRRVFPDLMEESYWDEFMKDLEDQHDAVLRDAPVHASDENSYSSQTDDEEEVDYFFDLDGEERWSPGQ